MRFGRLRVAKKGVILAMLVCGVALLAFPQRKKDENQTLQIPRDLPVTVEGNPHRFTFLLTALSNNGLLTKQVRGALDGLLHQAHGDTILKIRAFVAGSGDARRVRDLVSEAFSDHHEPLPVLSLVQTGGLPLEGAQVVLEGIVESKKETNPYGLVMISAQPQTSESPLDSTGPLVEKSLAAVQSAARSAGSEPADVERITCFLSSLDGVDAARARASAEFPKAASNFIQTQRSPSRALAACEAVARLRHDAGAPLTVLNPDGLPREAGQSQIALVGAPRAVLTGSQVSFGLAEKDTRLAFERLQKSLKQAGASSRSVAFAEYYLLSGAIAEQVRKVRTEFYDASRPPAGSLEPIEGLPSMDAGFAMDVIAVK